MKHSWNWKWLLFAPVVLGAATMFTIASLTPKRYRSEATILVVPQQVPDTYVKAAVTTPIEERLQSIQQQILSRTQLERIIEQENLYSDERRSGVMEDVVEKMRKDIEVTIVKGDAFKVRYEGAIPKTVMKVTEQLASLFISESLKDREVLTEGTNQFLESQLEDYRRRLQEMVKHRRAGIPPEDLETFNIENEALAAMYKSLVMKKEEANLASNLERRQIGEQFKLMDPARIADHPFAPNRPGMTIGGALIGFGVGLVLVLIVAVRRSAP